MDHSAARLVDTPAGSTYRAHLQSATFQTLLGSEPRTQLPKILQYTCCERFGCRILVVSGLAAGFSLAAGFRCFLLPLHLNRWRCLLKPCNGKFLNELRLIFRVLFRFRCMGCSVASFWNTPFRSASMAYLHSVVFQTRLGSEPWAQLPKVLQRACCKWIDCRILP